MEDGGIVKMVMIGVPSGILFPIDIHDDIVKSGTPKVFYDSIVINGLVNPLILLERDSYPFLNNNIYARMRFYDIQNDWIKVDYNGLQVKVGNEAYSVSSEFRDVINTVLNDEFRF